MRSFFTRDRLGSVERNALLFRVRERIEIRGRRETTGCSFATSSPTWKPLCFFPLPSLFFHAVLRPTGSSTTQDKRPAALLKFAPRPHCLEAHHKSVVPTPVHYWKEALISHAFFTRVQRDSEVLIALMSLSIAASCHESSSLRYTDATA